MWQVTKGNWLIWFNLITSTLHQNSFNKISLWVLTFLFVYAAFLCLFVGMVSGKMCKQKKESNNCRPTWLTGYNTSVLTHNHTTAPNLHGQNRWPLTDVLQVLAPSILAPPMITHTILDLDHVSLAITHSSPSSSPHTVNPRRFKINHSVNCNDIISLCTKQQSTSSAASTPLTINMELLNMHSLNQKYFIINDLILDSKLDGNRNMAWHVCVSSSQRGLPTMCLFFFFFSTGEAEAEVELCWFWKTHWIQEKCYLSFEFHAFVFGRPSILCVSFFQLYMLHMTEFLGTGDFNVHTDNLSDSLAREFFKPFELYGF